MFEDFGVRTNTRFGKFEVRDVRGWDFSGSRFDPTLLLIKGLRLDRAKGV